MQVRLRVCSVGSVSYTHLDVYKRQRFDEESNLEWKEILEQEGVKVLMGIPNKKVHAKLCVIKKRVHNKTIQYGFVSTGNFNEKTAKIYGDHLLMTSDRAIMADINKVFNVLRKPKGDIIPVSYTHLDVYKRQVHCHATCRFHVSQIDNAD